MRCMCARGVHPLGTAHASFRTHQRKNTRRHTPNPPTHPSVHLTQSVVRAAAARTPMRHGAPMARVHRRAPKSIRLRNPISVNTAP